MFYIFDSEFVPVARQLLLFLALPYAEVRLANLGCIGVIQFQFAVSFKCNNVTLGPVHGRARYSLIRYQTEYVAACVRYSVTYGG